MKRSLLVLAWTAFLVLLCMPCPLRGGTNTMEATAKTDLWATAICLYTDKEAEAFRSRLSMLTYPTTVESACEKLGIEVGQWQALGVGFQTGRVLDEYVRLSEHYWIDFALHGVIFWGTNSPVRNSAVNAPNVFRVDIYRREETSQSPIPSESELRDFSGRKTNTLPNGDTNAVPTQIEQALGQLAEADNSKSADQMYQAMRAMELMAGPGVDKSADPLTTRRQQTKMWLQLLATIDRNLDTNFDFENLPGVNLSLPRGGYPSGTDPKDIKDQEIRAEYEAALKKNNERIVRYSLQSGLLRVDWHASFDVENFLKGFYTCAPADQEELDGLLKDAGLSAPRRQKLRASVQNQ